MNRVAEAGHLTGCGERMFCPNRSISRGEMVALLHRRHVDPAS